MRNLLACLLLLLAAGAHADNDKPIAVSRLPEAAQQFVREHFPDRKIALAKTETDFMKKSYDVIFSDGCRIEFDSKGDWKEIDCKLSAMPSDVVPAPIRAYVEENHPDSTIVKIEKDRREYEVKLSNRVELTFDLNFNLIDIDY